MINTQNIHDRYHEIEKSFQDGRMSITDYTNAILQWNSDFTDIIKAQGNMLQDLSHGGKLHKRQVIDKNGNKVTKWVAEEDLTKEEKQNKNADGTPKEYKQTDAEKRYTIDDWKKNSKKATETALQNASKFASSEEIRKIARHELLARSLDVRKHIDMSLLPSFMLDSFVDKYQDVNKKISSRENKSISSYRDFGYYKVNKKLREDDKIDKKEKIIISDLDKAINKSELTHDIILHRGLSGKESLLFINYLSSLEPGDMFEEKSYSSTSLTQGQANKFKDLVSSTYNITLKIYASKGQKALSMQNLGEDDEKKIYSDEYEFLLPRNSKFQVIENKDKILSVKLL